MGASPEAGARRRMRPRWRNPTGTGRELAGRAWDATRARSTCLRREARRPGASLVTGQQPRAGRRPAGSPARSQHNCTRQPGGAPPPFGHPLLAHWHESSACVPALAASARRRGACPRHNHHNRRPRHRHRRRWSFRRRPILRCPARAQLHFPTTTHRQSHLRHRRHHEIHHHCHHHRHHHHQGGQNPSPQIHLRQPRQAPTNPGPSVHPTASTAPWHTPAPPFRRQLPGEPRRRPRGGSAIVCSQKRRASAPCGCGTAQGLRAREHAS